MECFDDLKIAILMPNRREKYNFRVLIDKFCFVHIRNSTLADIRFQSKNVEAFGYGGVHSLFIRVNIWIRY